MGEHWFGETTGRQLGPTSGNFLTCCESGPDIVHVVNEIEDELIKTE
jgi:hypothetical protein